MILCYIMPFLADLAIAPSFVCRELCLSRTIANRLCLWLIMYIVPYFLSVISGTDIAQPTTSSVMSRRA